MIYIKSNAEIKKMEEACRVAYLAQKAVEAAIRPATSPISKDQINENIIVFVLGVS